MNHKWIFCVDVGLMLKISLQYEKIPKSAIHNLFPCISDKKYSIHIPLKTFARKYIPLLFRMPSYTLNTDADAATAFNLIQLIYF